MTETEIRETLDRVRALVEALLGPRAKRVEFEDTFASTFHPAIAHEDLDEVLDASLLLDVGDLVEAVEGILLDRERERLAYERVRGSLDEALGDVREIERTLDSEPRRESPREPSPGAVPAARGGDCGCWSCEALRSLTEAVGETLPEPEPQSYGEAIVAAIRERTGGALPLSDHDDL